MLSGGPASVYADGAPALDPALLEADVPVLGICYGFQAMVQSLGGTVAHTGLREYGHTRARITDTLSTLFHGQTPDQSVWMSHGDSVSRAPEGMRGHRDLSRCAGRRVRGRRAAAVRRAVAPRGGALHVRSAGAGELPAPRCPPGTDLDAADGGRGAGGARSATRSVTRTCCARSPAGWTPRSRRHSCTRPWVTS